MEVNISNLVHIDRRLRRASLWLRIDIVLLMALVLGLIAVTVESSRGEPPPSAWLVAVPFAILCLALFALARPLRYAYRGAATVLLVVGVLSACLTTSGIFALLRAQVTQRETTQDGAILGSILPISVVLVVIALSWPILVGIYLTFRLHGQQLAHLEVSPVQCIRYETANPLITYSPERLLNAGILLLLPLSLPVLAFLVAIGPLFTAILLVAAAVAAWRLWPLARRRWQAGAREARQRDKRPPSLLLRSFQDDLLLLKPPWYRRGRQWVFEELLTGQLWCLGPVIAIGRPGEHLPPVGAARDYFTDDTWQTAAEQMVIASRTIAMIVGTTEGLGWEIRRIHNLGMLSKLMLVFPPVSAEQSADRWSGFCAHIEELEAASWLSAAPPKRLLLVVFPVVGEPVMLTVDDRRDPQAYQLAIAAAIQILSTREGSGSSSTNSTMHGVS